MPSDIIVKGDELKKLQEGLKELPSAINRVTSRSINYSVRKMRTDTWKHIQDKYNIKQADVYKYITMVMSNEHNLSGAEVVVAPHIPISKFPMTPSSPEPSEKPFVTFSVMKNRISYIPSSFVAQMPSGHIGLFVRDGRDQLPIDQKFTIGVAEMIGGAREEIMKDGHDAFVYEFGRLADMEMKKALEHKE